MRELPYKGATPEPALAGGRGNVSAIRSGAAVAAAGERLAIVTTAAAVAMLPLLEPHGPGNTAPVDLFIALAMFSSLLWLGVSGLKAYAPYWFAGSLIIAAGAAGAIAGPVPVDGLLAVLQDVWLLGFAICVANVCRTPYALSIVVRTWIYSAIAWAALLIVGELVGNAYLAGFEPGEGGRTSLTFGDANIAAYYFLTSILVIAAVRCPRSRAARVPAYALLLSAWALSGSNSGIIQLTLAIVLVGLLAIYRSSGLVPAIAAACCLLAAAAVMVPRVPLAQIQSRAHDSHYRLIREWVGRSGTSTRQREVVLSESVGLYYQGGPLGQGPTSTIHRLNANQANFAKESHNDYVAALLERGLVGAIGMALLVGTVFLRAWSVVLRPMSQGFAAVVPRTPPLLAAVTAAFVLATVYEVLHARHVWALFGLVAALDYWGRDQAS